MQKLSLAIAVSSLMMAAGCAQQQTTMQQEGAEHIVVSYSPAPAGAELLQTVTAVDGSGCRGFGHVGVRSLVEMELRNQALAAGGDYVQIVESQIPGTDVSGVCVNNSYQMQGQVYRVPGARNLSQRLAESGPVVMTSQKRSHEEPIFQPPAVKPREMRAPDDRERVLPEEDKWARRGFARYVPANTEAGQRTVRDEYGDYSPATVQMVPASQAPAPEMPQPSARSSAPYAPAVLPQPVITAPAPSAGHAPAAAPRVAPVVTAPAPAAAPRVAPVVTAPAPVERAVVAAPTVAAVKPVVSLPPPPSPVSDVEPEDMSMGSAGGMPLPDAGSSSMPMPQLAADSMPQPGVRQVSLSPAGKSGATASGGSLPREERDRMLEELARDSTLSYDDYQRRYREIMAQ